ncbi:hypothetical protein [Actinomadura verrucosospora]|uniref:Secreted protein n=1 Tax=Actinomadura verrucosospora TaxID=46165 RepID=A0A7D3VQH9_ACTVE|nr:hypothetical protein [Actinomadura verrucosospora]QKG19850.1 secreted protein [Actinomadura verrucosospora]
MTAASGSWSDWGQITFVLGFVALMTVLVVTILTVASRIVTARVSAARESDLKELVLRSQELENRIHGDLTELRDRVADMERILRTVE